MEQQPRHATIGTESYFARTLERRSVHQLCRGKSVADGLPAINGLRRLARPSPAEIRPAVEAVPLPAPEEQREAEEQ